MGTDARARPTGFFDHAAIVLATGLGAGFAPKAPGTAGSVMGVFIVLLVHGLHAGLHVGDWFPHAIVLGLVAGTWASGRVEAFWGHDAQRIVIDEVVGQMIALSLVVGRESMTAFSVLAGFGLFRLFDILKPFPLRRLERLKGGMGVMADDVGAGLYALGVLTMLLRMV